MFSSVPASACSCYSRTLEANNRISSPRGPPDDLNVGDHENLRVTAAYEYSTEENVAKPRVAERLDATSSIDFPVILIPEIATSVNALS